MELPQELEIVNNRFGLGVHLFFVLSAFSLAYSARMTGDGLGVYVMKRFFRIAPLFYAMIIFYSLWFQFAPIEVILLNLSFLFNLVPGYETSIVWAGWTIGVEMLFYGVLPLLIAVSSTRLASFVLAIGAVAVSLTVKALLESTPGLPSGFAHYAFLSNIGVFCIGLFAYMCFRDDKQRTRSASIAAIGTVALAAVILSPIGNVLIRPGRPDIMAMSVVFAGLTFWQATRPSWIMRSSLLQFMGERSFSMYLLHPFIIHLLKPGIYPWISQQFSGIGQWAYLICAAVTLVAVVVAADVTYRLIEIPGMDAGRWAISKTRLRVKPTG